MQDYKVYMNWVLHNEEKEAEEEGDGNLYVCVCVCLCKSTRDNHWPVQ